MLHILNVAHQGAARNAASVHLRLIIMRADILVKQSLRLFKSGKIFPRMSYLTV